MKARRNQPTARTRSPRDRYSSAPRIRAGILMSRDMNFGGMGDMEAVMAGEGLTLAPMTIDGRPVERVLGPPHVTVSVLPTAGMGDVEGGSLVGVVLPGSTDGRSTESDAAFDHLVSTACNENMPVLAFGEGVPRALHAVGYDAPAELPAGLLIHHGVRILETVDDVRDALRTFTQPQPALHAA